MLAKMDVLDAPSNGTEVDGVDGVMALWRSLRLTPSDVILQLAKWPLNERVRLDIL